MKTIIKFIKRSFHYLFPKKSAKFQKNKRILYKQELVGGITQTIVQENGKIYKVKRKGIDLISKAEL